MNDIVRIFVGADRSQVLAVKVLEHSIKRHTQLQVEVFPMVDLPVPVPKDPRNSQRTGFSFSRFCIPKLAGFKGKAIYMDADMLVFKDIKYLWETPLDGASIAIQKEVKNANLTVGKEGAPRKRIKQCAVMLLDCSKLTWHVQDIIEDMDNGKYGYEELMYHLVILEEGEIRYSIPGEWNSLEHYDPTTCLLHYTDVATQPWTSAMNRLAEHWLAEVRLMLKNGSLNMEEIKREIELGFFRPSLVRDIKFGHWFPVGTKTLFNSFNRYLDKFLGYKPHRAVYEAKRRREAAIREYEAAKQSN